MGWAYIIGTCFGCKKPFSFHPHRVPAIRVNSRGEQDPNGSREPICQTCVDAVNPMRVKNGLVPIQILPGAYEPCNAQEL